MMRADNIKSRALAGPINRGRIHATPYSAINPRRENAVPNFASDEAKRRSQYSVRMNPKPTACPLTAAITGFLIDGK